MSPARDFIELSGPQTTSRLSADSVLVLPLGAIEHHGPHLPLATDHIIAEAFARRLAEEYGAESQAWLLPSLAVTKSDEHAWAPGTLWFSWDTLMRVLIDLGRSLVTTPARRLVFVNGHGGNSALLQVACRELRREFGLQTFLMHPAVPVDQGGTESAAAELGMGVHGGRQETSLLLHLRPDLVDMSSAERAVPDQLSKYQYIGFGKFVSFGWLSDDFGTDGVIGDPRGASAAEGEQLFRSAVSVGAAALAEISRFRPGP